MEQIIVCLKDKKKGEDCKKRLAYCGIPKTEEDIKCSHIEGNVFQILYDLRDAETLSSENGKYLVTPLGIIAL
ncbi:MAG: hypothetical protein QG670_525 [Thermoproteota archaeon]|nr:hypothetical protein [Thermoproteota archaeon]